MRSGAALGHEPKFDKENIIPPEGSVIPAKRSATRRLIAPRQTRKSSICSTKRWPGKATLIYRRTKNLRAVQLLLGHTNLDSTVRYLGIEIDDALEMSEQIDV